MNVTCWEMILYKRAAADLMKPVMFLFSTSARDLPVNVHFHKCISGFIHSHQHNIRFGMHYSGRFISCSCLSDFDLLLLQTSLLLEGYFPKVWGHLVPDYYNLFIYFASSDLKKQERSSRRGARRAEKGRWMGLVDANKQTKKKKNNSCFALFFFKSPTVRSCRSLMGNPIYTNDWTKSSLNLEPY